MLKLYTTRHNAQASVKDERAFSAYITVHRTFNVIDADYRKADKPVANVDTQDITIQMV
jgi:hypothetical protein